MILSFRNQTIKCKNQDIVVVERNLERAAMARISCRTSRPYDNTVALSHSFDICLYSRMSAYMNDMD